MVRIASVAAVLALSLLGVLLWLEHRPRPRTVSGAVEIEQIHVGSRVGGRVAEVFVEEGSTVGKGSLLFRLEPFDAQERLRQAEADFRQAQAELDKLRNGFRKEEIAQAEARRDQAKAVLNELEAGPRPQELQAARARVDRANADIELARVELTRQKNLLEEDNSASIEYERAVRNQRAAEAELAEAGEALSLLEAGTRAEVLAQSRAQLEEAEESLALYKAGAREEEIRMAEAAVASAKARVDAIQVQIAELEVKSPCDCIIESFNLRPGDLVGPNAPAVSLLDPSLRWIRAYVLEKDLSTIQLGREVYIRFDGLPDRWVKGTIQFISGQAEFTPRNVQTPEERSKQVFRIKVVLNPRSEPWRAGMMADVYLEMPAGEDAVSLAQGG